MVQGREGCSVTQRIGSIKQPKGGYIVPKSMKRETLSNEFGALNEKENVQPRLIGTAIDYLTRFMSGTEKKEAFHISIKGAEIIDEEKHAFKLLNKVKGLDDESIVNAIKLTGFDVCLRNDPSKYKPVEDIKPDSPTIENVRIMVNRSLNFFKLYGPKTVDGFTFEGGYTDVVVAGDGDFLTKDTLWDFKVSTKGPKAEHTLQLLMYWRMGLHSIHKEFKDISNLGIFNPRLNVVYRLSVDSIPQSVIDEVETAVIGY